MWLIWLSLTGQSTFAVNAPVQALLLMSAGLATVIPLLLFAAAARRVPLSTIGLLQYLAPVLQLICGVLFLGESMAPSRWAGFAIVWTALAVLTLDSLRHARRTRGIRRGAEQTSAAQAGVPPPISSPTT